jgi:hypothetical protein
VKKGFYSFSRNVRLDEPELLIVGSNAAQDVGQKGSPVSKIADGDHPI